MARPWQPSKRASELIAALWDAFEQGDRWVRVQHPSTARYTGVSLVWNGVAEVDPNNDRRFRLSTACLAANGIPARNVRLHLAQMAELAALDAADLAAVAS